MSKFDYVAIAMEGEPVMRGLSQQEKMIFAPEPEPELEPRPEPAPGLSPEDQAYYDAYRVTWPGASNPGAVAATLARHEKALMQLLQDTRAVREHPALHVITAQLALLHGVTAMGAKDEKWDAVTRRVTELGLANPDCP